MKRVLSLFLALTLAVGLSLPGGIVAFAKDATVQGDSGVFSVEEKTRVNELNRYYTEVSIGEIGEGPCVLFETHRDQNGGYHSPQAKVTYTLKNKNITGLEVSLNPTFEEKLILGASTVTQSSTGERVSFTLTTKDTTISASGLENYTGAVVITGVIGGERVILDTLGASYVVGPFIDVHDEKALSRWSGGTTVNLSGQRLLSVGEVSKRDTTMPSFTFTYSPYVYSLSHVAADNDHGYVRSLTLSPGGPFTFLDGSYEQEVLGDQGTVSITILPRADAIAQMSGGYYYTGLELRFDDGCWFGNKGTGELPLVVYVKSGSSGGGGGGGGGGGSSSGGSAGGSGTAPSTADGSLIEARPATAGEVNTAIQAALTAGGTSIRLENVSTVDPTVLKAAALEAQKAGKTVTLHCDTVKDGKVLSRLSLSLPKAAALTAPISTGVELNTTRTQGIVTKFTTYYKNTLQAVSLTQKGSFGMEVELALKLDMTGMDMKTITFYHYDSEKNTYAPFDGKSWMDGSGYLHLTTELGGDLLISSGPLAVK